MAVNLRTLVTALSRFVGLMFIARGLSAFGPWISLRSLSEKESVFEPVRNVLAIGGITNLIVGIVFFALAHLLAKWAAPENASQLEGEPEGIAVVGVRLVALAFVGFGTVLAVSSAAGWYLQVSSADVNELWFSGERVRSGALQGSFAIAVGVGMWLTSRWIAGHLARSRRDAA